MHSFLPTVLMVPLLAASTASGQDQGSAEARLLSSYAAAWSSHDVEKVAAYFTDDAIYEDVTLGHLWRDRQKLLRSRRVGDAAREWKDPAQFRLLEHGRVPAANGSSGCQRRLAEGPPSTHCGLWVRV